MGIIFTGLSAYGFFKLGGQLAALRWRQFVQILQWPAILNTLFDFPVCSRIELKAAPDYVCQPALERECSVALRGDTVGQNFLEPRCSVADSAEDKIIDPQKMKRGIEVGGLSGLAHGEVKFEHVILYSKRDITTRCIAVREVSVLVN